MTESLPVRETSRVGWGGGVGQLLTLLCGFDSGEQVGQRGSCQDRLSVARGGKWAPPQQMCMCWLLG